MSDSVTVYGAYGHTGRFVVEELRKRGLVPILSGRDPEKLAELAIAYPGCWVIPASIDDAASLDAALEGASAVINCAGPFLDSATALIEAALRAKTHYLDVTAEQQAAINAFDQFGRRAKEAGIAVVPAVAFYGGLADLLATAAMGDWSEADEINIAIALDSWEPTRGTRLTGERNTFRRRVLSNSELVELADPPPHRDWDFCEPFGTQEVVALPLSEIITISSHLRVAEIQSWINLTPLQDLRDPNTPEPTAADESGRSAQLFMMDVTVRKGRDQRRATASGRDIYAFTAPLVVEATARILDGRRKRNGVVAAGEIFDAEDFLRSLGAENVQFEIR